MDDVLFNVPLLSFSTTYFSTTTFPVAVLFVVALSVYDL